MYICMYLCVYHIYIHKQRDNQPSVKEHRNMVYRKKSFLSQCSIIFNISTQRQRQADFYEVESSLVYKVS